MHEDNGELGGHQFINMGRLQNHWTDRDQIWHTYTYSPGNGHRLNKLTPRAPRVIGWGGGSRGHTFKNVGKKTNNWTDREQIWHTYAYPSACEWT